MTGQPVKTNGITVTDFSYELSNFINGEANVRIVNGELNINLGTPKPEAMDYFPNVFDQGSTITSHDAKVFSIDMFFEAYSGHNIYCKTDEHTAAMLVYVDKNVTINGSETHDDGYVGKYNNVTLNKGWNYFIFRENKATTTITFTVSSKLPDGFMWVVK